MNKTSGDWASRTEAAVLEAALPRAGAAGWSWVLVIRSGAEIGLSEGETRLLLPRGPADLAALMSRHVDETALETLSAVDASALKIRERIAQAVGAWLDAACAEQAAARRWTGWLALPTNLALAARLAWASADTLWRWAGDTATDENHYSKRAILSAILTSATAVRLSSGAEAARDYVDRRIGDVMSFEKWKAKTPLRPSKAAAAVAGALSRWRYPAAG